jgi:hypothetical protein
MKKQYTKKELHKILKWAKKERDEWVKFIKEVELKIKKIK